MQRCAAVAVMFALSGCGRIGFAELADGDAGNIGDAGDAAAPDPRLRPCTGPVLFDDAFDVPGAGPIFTTVQGGSTQIPATEVSGELVFDLAGSISGDSYRGYRTVAPYPLAGLCVIVEASRFPTASDTCAYLKFGDSTHMAETFLVRSGTTTELTFRTWAPRMGGGTTLDQEVAISFDPSMRFWRLQQVGNRTYWDVSTDGTKFVQHAELADLFSESEVVIELGAGAIVDVTSGGQIAYERITVHGP